MNRRLAMLIQGAHVPTSMLRPRRVRKADLYHVPWVNDINQNLREWEHVRHMLDQLGLKVYLDEEVGIYLIGFPKGAVHDHDRWLYRTDRSMVRDPFYYTQGQLAWCEVPTEAGSANGMQAVNLPAGNIVKALETLVANCRYGVELLANHPGTSLAALLRFKTTIAYRPEWWQESMANQQVENLDCATLHSILHHWPDWLRRNPEFLDMPRDTVARMHGLGPLLDGGFQLPWVDVEAGA